MIEQDLARIAGALEQIAQAMASPSQIAVGNLQQVEIGPLPSAFEAPAPQVSEFNPQLRYYGAAIPLPTDIDTEAAQAGNADDADHLRREDLKKSLRALGVAFKDSARTGTLQKLLDDKLASMPHPETEGDAAAEPPQETEEPGSEAPVTRDDVRMALIELSAAKGKDAALAMLRKVGGAEKLSDVAEDRYAELTKACKEQSNG